jgi:hypothetical protein
MLGRIDNGFIGHVENLDAEELSFYVPQTIARDRRSLFYTSPAEM